MRRAPTNSPARKSRVVLYSRVSNQEQVDGYSLTAQRRAMHAWCDMSPDEYEIVGEYTDEGISARYDAIEKRPGFEPPSRRCARPTLT